jgi:hypothetical protein
MLIPLTSGTLHPCTPTRPCAPASHRRSGAAGGVASTRPHHTLPAIRGLPTTPCPLFPHHFLPSQAVEQSTHHHAKSSAEHRHRPIFGHLLLVRGPSHPCTSCYLGIEAWDRRLQGLDWLLPPPRPCFGEHLPPECLNILFSLRPVHHPCEHLMQSWNTEEHSPITEEPSLTPNTPAAPVSNHLPVELPTPMLPSWFSV